MIEGPCPGVVSVATEAWTRTLTESNGRGWDSSYAPLEKVRGFEKQSIRLGLMHEASWFERRTVVLSGLNWMDEIYSYGSR